MAAVTVAESKRTIFGNLRVVMAKLTAPADGDTWNTGLSKIYSVQTTLSGATQATSFATTPAVSAPDNVGVNSISGGTITFEVSGTARDVYVVVHGI